MPIGVIINAVSVAIGGILGALVGNKLNEDFRKCVHISNTDMVTDRFFAQFRGKTWELLKD